MNKILKFRAWDGEKMISPDYACRQGYGWWTENSIPTYSDKVMQFTGLYDKNGKEIYEGDVVSGGNSWASHVENEVVKFENGGFSPFSVAGWECTPSPEDCEIIGNVFENPELLDGTPR